jgi:hypothetical protein
LAEGGGVEAGVGAADTTGAGVAGRGVATATVVDGFGCETPGPDAGVRMKR